MIYKEQRNTRTGETRWVPVEEEKKEASKSWSKQAASVPILGDILGTVIPSLSGSAANRATPMREAANERAFKQSQELIKQAKQEKDKYKKEELLKKSREIMEKSGEDTQKYVSELESSMGNFVGRESPKGLIQTLTAYAPQATRTAVAAGTLLAPQVSGVFSPATSAAGRIVTSAMTGGTTAGIYGAASKDVADLEDRIKDTLGYGITGFGLGLAFGAGREIVNKVAANKTFQKMIEQKGLNKMKPTKAWADLTTEGAEQASSPFSLPQLKDDLVSEIKKKTALGPDRNKLLKMADEVWKPGKSADVIVQKDGSLLLNSAQESEMKTILEALTERRAIGKASFWNRLMGGHDVKLADQFDSLLYSAYNKQLHQIPDIAKYDAAMSKYLSRMKAFKGLGGTLLVGKVLKAFGIDPAIFLPRF